MGDRGEALKSRRRTVAVKFQGKALTALGLSSETARDVPCLA
jgi:hypothetical protein